MNHSSKLTKEAVIGAANGVLFMTFFGALWASIGIIGSRGLGSPWLLVITCGITLLLLTGSITLFGKARKLTRSVTSEDRNHWREVNKRFGLIFGLEGIAIAIASVICNITDHFELFFPIMAIIVGIHFFPLAQLFRVFGYHVTGAVLCVLGIFTFFLPINATMGGEWVVVSSVFIGLGSALTLWVTGLLIWTSTLSKLK